MSRSPHTCVKCILNSEDDPNITFDSSGVCNYCRQYEHEAEVMSAKKSARNSLGQILKQIKESGIGKPYDCILGVSGGTDSTYLAYQAIQLGLRPLVVHYDNGWNSELAVKNIQSTVEKLKLDLHTYVNNWEEFKDIQLSFLKASVIDIELVSDQGIIACLYLEAMKRNIKYIITGHNHVTEAILPSSWYHLKTDVLNIKAIHRRFGSINMKTYPMMNYFQRAYAHRVLGIKAVNLLDYLPYQKEDAKALLASELGWRDYGGKHHESVFTRFYQGYILPVKFGVEKRKAHLSTLINSGQISREEAVKEAALPLYEKQLLDEDRNYILKKFELSSAEFDEMMKAKPRSHLDFPSYLTRHYRIELWLSRTLKPITRPVRKWFKI